VNGAENDGNVRMARADMRRIWSFAAAGALLSLVAFTTRSAGQRAAPQLSTGARIKLVAPAAGVPWNATAIVDSLGEDTLYVRSLSEPPGLRSASRVSIPLGAIRQLQVSGGSASRIGRAGRGALWGLAVYAVFAGTYIAHEKATCQGPECFGEGLAWIPLAGGVPWSAGIGATIGAALPVEHWHRVPLDGIR
jgi:hypothetical protein